MMHLMKYLHKWSCWKQKQVHVESQNSQRYWGDLVQTHLEKLRGQEQQTQVGSSLSVSHSDTF